MQSGKVREMRVMRQYYSSLNNRPSMGVRTTILYCPGVYGVKLYGILVEQAPNKK
jgi:hypothetical protein